MAGENIIWGAGGACVEGNEHGVVVAWHGSGTGVVELHRAEYAWDAGLAVC